MPYIDSVYCTEKYGKVKVYRLRNSQPKEFRIKTARNFNHQRLEDRLQLNLKHANDFEDTPQISEAESISMSNEMDFSNQNFKNLRVHQSQPNMLPYNVCFFR